VFAHQNGTQRSPFRRHLVAKHRPTRASRVVTKTEEKKVLAGALLVAKHRPTRTSRVVTKSVVRQHPSGGQTLSHPDKPGGDEDRRNSAAALW
jgi:plasmid replication initiation protein